MFVHEIDNQKQFARSGPNLRVVFVEESYSGINVFATSFEFEVSGTIRYIVKTC